MTTLSLPGTTGNYATTPDSAANSITSSIDIRVKCALNDWTPSADRGLCAKWGGTNAYAFLVASGANVGKLEFDLQGASGVSSVATGITDGATKWVRVAWDDTTNLAKFYTSDDGSSWTQLGTDITVSRAGILDTTQVFAMGAGDNTGALAWAGKLYRVQLRNNVLDDGTGIVLDANFEAQTVGATSFVESSSNAATITIVGTAAIVATEVPSEISGLSLWIDASDATSLWQNLDGTNRVSWDGNAVGRWADKSFNARHVVVAANTTVRPAFKVGVKNDRSVIRFDGSDDQMTTATGWSAFSAATTTAYTALFVVAAASATNPLHAYDAPGPWGDAGGYVSNYFRGTTNEIGAFNWDGNELYVEAAYTFGTWKLVTQKFSGGAGGTLSLRLDKSDAGNVTTGVTQSTGGILLVGRGFSARYNGDIAEIVIYNRALNDTERGLVEDYLWAKWFTPAAVDTAGLSHFRRGELLPEIAGASSTTGFDYWRRGEPFPTTITVAAAAPSVFTVGALPVGA